MDKQTEKLRIKLNAECLKRSKYWGCRMECELETAREGYCREVWKKVEK
jgi:hypothetical protein